MDFLYVVLILAGFLSTLMGRCVGCNDPSRILYDSAVCHLHSDSSSPLNGIEGLVNFTQAKPCYDNTLVHVNVTITGLPPTIGRIRHHGFHIHEFGDLTNGCRSMGGHYNPHLAPHGSPNDPPSARHVGDLGNVYSDVSGNVRMDYYAPASVTLRGDMTIIGRGIVLHEDRDDLGRAGNLGSFRTGNAGRRIACCVIVESVK